MRTGADDRDRRRAARAGRRRRHRAPIGPPARSRMCDWGVLVYKLDVTKLNSYGSIQVVDSSRGSTAWGCTRDVDIATLGKGQGDGPPRYEDADTGTVIEVQAIDDAAGSRDAEGHPRDHPHHRHDARASRPFTTTLTAAGPPSATFTWDDGATGTTSRAHVRRAGTHTVTRHGEQRRHGDQARSRSTRRRPATVAADRAAERGHRQRGRTSPRALAGQDLTIEAYRAGVKVAERHEHASATARPSRRPTRSSPAPRRARPASRPAPRWPPTTANLKAVPTAIRTVSWRAAATRRPVGRRVARRLELRRHRHRSNRNGMTALQGAGGSAANAGVLYYGAREYKDFELSVDYRGAATNSNGGVLLRFPKPADDGRRRPQRLPGRDPRQRHRRDPHRRDPAGAAGARRTRPRARPASSPRASGTRCTSPRSAGRSPFASTARRSASTTTPAAARATSASRTRAPA